jgi:hypothetical protein
MDGKKETRKGNPIIKLGSCYEMRIMTVFTTTKLLPSMFAVNRSLFPFIQI